MDTEWFYLEAGEQRGPVSERELAGLLRSRLPRTTLVWHDGMADWTAAAEVKELAAAKPSPPPPPPPPVVAAPPPPPLPAYAPPSRGLEAPPREPAPSSSRTQARPASDPESLNPFVLWGRSFRFTGTFNRVEFAIACFGALFAAFVAFLALGFWGLAMEGRSGPDSEMLIGFIVLIGSPVVFVILLGASARRLHDLGLSGWLALVHLLPCMSLFFAIYLAAAPAPGASGRVASPAAPRPTGAPLPAAPPAAVPGGLHWVIIAVAVVFGGIMLIGIVAAIAIPSLLRARVSANESTAIGDIRSVISAQMAYQTMNGGLYEGRLECLAEPDPCLPGSPGSAVVDASILANPKNGYLRELIAGSAPESLPEGSSPSSATSFAFVAHPAGQGQTGVRSFCGDHTGRVCFDPEGRRDLVDRNAAEVLCSASCQDLQ